MRLSIWLTIFSCLCASAQVSDKTLPSPAGAAATPVVPSAPQRRVTAFISATDRSGKPIRELAKDQISVLDNSESGQILDLRAANQIPLDLGIVLLATKGDFGQQQAAAVDLIHKVLRPNIDHVFVVTAGGDKPWPNPHLEWVTDPIVLEKTIRTLDHNAGLPDAFAFDLNTYEAGQNRHLNIQHYQGGGSGVFNILWSMMKSDPRPVRRAVVIFRSAWAHSTGLGNTVNQLVDAQHSRIIADAQQLWIPFYIIGVQEPPAAPPALSKTYAPTFTGAGGYNRVYDQDMERLRERAYNTGQVNLERMAAETGGKIWWSAKKNYSDAVAGIAQALDSSYAVVYAVPVNPSAGPEHTLEVTPSNPTTRISGQKKYYSRSSQLASPPQVSAPSPVTH